MLYVLVIFPEKLANVEEQTLLKLSKYTVEPERA